MIESRMIREARQRREDDEAGFEFVELLLEALEIPEVQEAVTQAVHQMRSRPTVPSATRTSHVSARGRRR